MANPKENSFTFTPLNFKEKKINPESDDKSNKISDFLDKYNPLVFCRTCANMDSYLVPIFKEEGLNYSLNKKIEKYLPIQISEEDGLPLQMCYHCASTLIAWDTLVIGCVEAEKKLMILKNSQETKSYEESIGDVNGVLNDNVDSDDEPLLKKTSARLNKISEKRDILQEKNDLQICKATDNKTERFTEEPGLSFSTYQHQIAKGRPFILKILNLRIDNSFSYKLSAAVKNVELLVPSFLKKINQCDSIAEKNKSNIVFSKTAIENQTFLKLKTVVAGENCGESSGYKSNVGTHCEEKTSTCHICGKGFKQRFNLLRHVRVVHEGLLKHVCENCGKKYRSRGELEDHRNIHTTKRKIFCDECGGMFLTKASLHSHKKSHRKKISKKVKFVCEECKKDFTTKKSRNQHLLIHTKEKPIVCSECGKNFRTRANFNQHAKIHSKLKPFNCDHCGKTFGRKDHLKIHIRSHTGEKPYTCNLCGKSFSQPNDLKKHLKIHKQKL